MTMKQITFAGGSIEVSETITAEELMAMHAELCEDAQLHLGMFDGASLLEAMKLGNAAMLAANKAQAALSAARAINPVYVRQTLQVRAAAAWRELPCRCGHVRGRHMQAIPYSCTAEGCGCERFSLLER